jgi:hypothetical protein
MERAVLLDGLGSAEGPRRRDGRLSFPDSEQGDAPASGALERLAPRKWTVSESA